MIPPRPTAERCACLADVCAAHLALHVAGGATADEVADRFGDLASLLDRYYHGRSPSSDRALGAGYEVRNRLDTRWVPGWLADLAKSLRDEPPPTQPNPEVAR